MVRVPLTPMNSDTKAATVPPKSPPTGLAAMVEKPSVESAAMAAMVSTPEPATVPVEVAVGSWLAMVVLDTVVEVEVPLVPEPVELAHLPPVVQVVQVVDSMRVVVVVDTATAAMVA